jgi:hypothetical protein
MMRLSSARTRRSSAAAWALAGKLAAVVLVAATGLEGIKPIGLIGLTVVESSQDSISGLASNESCNYLFDREISALFTASILRPRGAGRNDFATST